jgi:hypothetical protein
MSFNKIFMFDLLIIYETRGEDIHQNKTESFYHCTALPALQYRLRCFKDKQGRSVKIYSGTHCLQFLAR